MFRQIFQHLSLAVIVPICGCSTVIMMDGSEGPTSDKVCDVRVFQSQTQALKGGAIEELCLITGDTSFRLSHHSSEAIAKHKSKACACGASAVYVQSRVDGDLNMQGQVTMVAFRYVSASSSGAQQTATPLGATQASQPTSSVVAKDAETDRVIQFLSENGFPLVGVPVKFKQKGNTSFYEARGAGAKMTQVLCESNNCRFRTIND